MGVRPSCSTAAICPDGFGAAYAAWRALHNAAMIAQTQVPRDAASLAAREAAAKAQAIEDAVYNLKAVNPNKKAALDTRTPGELLDLMELKGKGVTEALATLRVMG